MSVEGSEFFMRTPQFATNQMFGSREELIDWVQTLAKSLGIVIVMRRSNKRASGFVYKSTLICDRGREYTGLNSSRTTGTKRINCPFKLEGLYFEQYNSWMLKVICNEHNHQPIRYMEGHPYAQRLSDNEFSLVAELFRMNMAPRDILSVIKQHYPNNVSLLSTIYNAIKKIRMMETGGKSPMQVLMSILHSSGYTYYYTTGTSNELENLFFIHPISFNIWRAYPHVLIIDATYKTNRYKMTFVEIVGVTSTSKTFCIAFAFIHDETTVRYEWVLNCLKLTLGECMLPLVIVTDREMALINACRGVFPDAARLLCRWHIRHNIIDKWKRSFKRKDDWTAFYDLWTLLEGSSTLKTYTGYSYQTKFGKEHKCSHS
ncbi:protein FAR1-RELATED SEQUENCE 5-like [Rutidosis leptorrhynchoides]|uniref:protein FAR1-RELATED SEQUENCE 5-like n=1 Tax=Rutidosis leptorrhynchoides TaxID=125765 RepID=UPI003A99B17A